MADSKCCWQCPEDWEQWSQWLAAGLHARNRWRLPVLLAGILFAHGRRTVTTWLRAAGVSDDYQDYYYFLAALGRKTKSVATQLLILVLRILPLPDRLLAVIDDTPTKRYGPHVEGADIHHNPTPGPADQKYLYGHIWVTLSLAVRHPCFGALALPLAGHALRASENDGQDSEVARLDVCHQARAGGSTGRVDRSDRQKGRKNAVDRRRWRLCESALLETCFAGRGDGDWAAAQGRGVARLAAEAATRKTAQAGPSAQVRQEQDQSGQAGRPSRWLADGPMHGLWQDGHQALQDVLGDLPAGRRSDSRGDCRGGSRLVPVLLDRSQRHGRGDYRSLRRPRDDRTGLPRREGSLGRGPAAGAEHLDQHGGLSSESLDSHAGGTLVLEPPSRANCAIAACRRGTTPNVVRPMPIAAKPCGDKSWNTNYQRLPPSGGCREKILQLTKRLMALAT